MPTAFMLAPNARWQGRDQTGEPVIGGKLYTYLNKTVSDKPTYLDYLGANPNMNPVILDGKGEANIYWADDDLYTIKLFTSADVEVYTQDDYPVVGTNTTRTVSESESNIARNNQFSYWYYGSSFAPVVGVGSVADQDYICDDWYYSRVGTAYVVDITRQTFAADQDAVPNNPLYYFRYASGVPAAETLTRLYQTYSSVQTLANTAVSVAFRGQSSTSSVVNVFMVQNFGGGGSANVETLVGQFTLTTSWALYNASITIPSMVGKTVGTDSKLLLEIRFPNDVAATVDLCNVQLQVGDSLSNFPFQSQSTQFQELVNRLQDGLPSTGDMKPSYKTVADPGWLLCDDTTIGNTTSGAATTGLYTKALFTLLWTNMIDTWSPMLASTGAASTRGASAEDDWNDLKRLTLSRTLGRAVAQYGSGAGLTARVMGEYLGNEAETIAIANLPAHDHPGSTLPSNIGVSGGLPGVSGLSHDTAAVSSVPITVASQGGANDLPNMQPSSFVNYMIKL